MGVMLAPEPGAALTGCGRTHGRKMANSPRATFFLSVVDDVTTRRRGLGVFGGTFDPLHAGHLHIAETAARLLPVESVLWIPSGDPGHRDAPRVAARHRLAMVEAAIEGNPRFALDPAEIESGRPTFTVPTLERLRGIHGPDRPIVLISGADSFLTLPTWRDWRRLFALAHIAVAARPGYALGEAAMERVLRDEFEARAGPIEALASAPAGGIAVFPLTPLDVSASDLRARLAAGERPADLLPLPVLAYIEAHGLYRERSA